MLSALKSIFKLMGQGLAHQYLGEMTPYPEKIAEIEKRCHNYNMSGGRSRVVLLASTDLLGAAFDFVVALANSTNSLIEVLYLKPDKETESHLQALLNRLSDLAQDFQITFITDDPQKTISSYHNQRQDIMAVVSSASELFLEELGLTTPTPRSAIHILYPDILIIGNSLPA
jgi:cob(I)alamin adenosyltransferase